MGPGADRVGGGAHRGAKKSHHRWFDAGRVDHQMYLAKFFHRPPGDDGRELLLILDSSCGDAHSLMTFVMGGQSEPCQRRDFTNAHDAVAALRREAEALRRQGYGETAETR